MKKNVFKKLKNMMFWADSPSSGMVVGKGRDLKITEIRCNDVIGGCEKQVVNICIYSRKAE